MYPLRYLPSGHILIDPEDDCDGVVDAMLETEYSGEFCFGLFNNEEPDLNAEFFNRLMEAGFLVMSAELQDNEAADSDPGDGDPSGIVPFYIVLPKLHLVRSALFFPDLHVKRSIRPFLPRYELRFDADFDTILDKCLQIHGGAWLTPPLVEAIKTLRERKDLAARPVSFALYRDGDLKAGEIGVAMGRVYTSYSGFHGEDNAGTVQMIKMAEWMRDSGFDFLDFGMPLDYKTDLGAKNIMPRRFVELFRSARY